MATKTLITVEEFARQFGKLDTFQELVEGEVINVSPAMFLHNHVRDTVLVLLKTFVEAHQLGVVVSEQPFHLFGNTVRFPDVAFVRSGRALPLLELPQGAPDLAIEVISPTNTAHEVSTRLSDFFAGGSTRVWAIYPEHRELYIHHLSGVTRRERDEILDDPQLLPGFSVKVSSLFETA